MTILKLPSAVAVLQGGELSEYYPGASDAGSTVGSVIVGRVERVLSDMKTAFVDIGQNKNGFLPLREQSEYQAQNGDRQLRSGDSVIVQVKKDAHADKGAFLTRDVTLVGEYALVMPFNRHIGASSRVNRAAERARLIALGEDIAGGRFGLIMRHAALTARLRDITDEIAALYDEALEIIKRAPCLKPPYVLRPAPDTVALLQRDYSARYTVELCEEPAPEQLRAVKKGLEAALSRTVTLKNGGTLIFDEREALTTVDVNTAGYVGGGNESATLSQNLIAADAIARQIRLRSISGIILIDFIDMDTDEEREQVISAMRQALSEDRVKTVIHGFTSLGLLEMTRKRTREPLSSLLLAPCPRCKGAGYIGEDATL